MTATCAVRRHLLGMALGSAALRTLAAPAPADQDATLFPRNFEGMPLVDQDQRRFSFQALQGRVLLVHFVYTGCSTTCPLQTLELAKVQRALSAADAPRVHFVSVTLDPLGDTPAALKAFALRMSADLSRWSFVTGRPADIGRVAERLRLFRAGGRQPDDHATALWLVDGRGRLLQRLPGHPPDKLRLVRELQAMAALT